MSQSKVISSRAHVKNFSIGQRFHSWTILGEAFRKGRSKSYLCRCDCGVEKPVDHWSLKSGMSKSCGTHAGRNNKHITHGRSDTRLYRLWMMMRDRCRNPKNHAYLDYGGRGIEVCERWHKFENFYADMGERPAGLTLDRINNDGNYEPGNCRWATRAQQGRNKRNNHIVTVNGESKCVSEWAAGLSAPRRLVSVRLSRGWSDERAVLTPVAK